MYILKKYLNCQATYLPKPELPVKKVFFLYYNIDSKQAASHLYTLKLPLLQSWATVQTRSTFTAVVEKLLLAVMIFKWGILSFTKDCKH